MTTVKIYRPSYGDINLNKPNTRGGRLDMCIFISIQINVSEAAINHPYVDVFSWFIHLIYGKQMIKFGHRGSYLGKIRLFRDG